MNLVINQTSIQPHTSMLLAGAIELSRQGLIDLDIRDNRYSNNRIPATIGVTEALIDGKLCYFDYSDGYSDCIEFKQNLLRTSDFYFRRSYSTKYNDELFPEYKNKIFPLGMNYYVYSRDQKITFDRRPLWKQIARSLLGYKADNKFTIDVFEQKPDYKKNHPVILFYTRLREETSEEYGRFNDEINNMRINIIRALQERYGNYFHGGVYQNDVAESLCPDLIVSTRLTDRFNYLQNMKSSDICIGTMVFMSRLVGKLLNTLRLVVLLFRKNFALKSLAILSISVIIWSFHPWMSVWNKYNS